MSTPNDTSPYSRDKYKARKSSYFNTRPSSKYDDVRNSSGGRISSQEHLSSHYPSADPHGIDERRQYDRSQYVSQAYPGTREASGGSVASMQRRKSKAPLVIAIVLIVAIAAVAAWYFLFPRSFDVTVNGQQVTVTSFTTLQDLVDDGYATPQAGDLLAVDGSLLTAGGGEALHATINDDETSDPQARLVKDAVVTIGDGHDTEEEHTEVVEAIPFGTVQGASSPASYYQGALHVVSKGEDGSRSTRTGAVSGITVSSVTKEPIDAGFHAFDANVGDDKVIALTFDDGPWPTTTKEILSILQENGAHATFFVIGDQCEDHPELVKEIIAKGNQVATHSYDHAKGSGDGVDLTRMSTTQQINEVEKGFKAIEEAAGRSVSRVMRAPGGNYYGQLVTTLEPYVNAEIGWNVDTTDWKKPGVDVIVNQLLSVKPGEVVLMHDGGGDRSQTVAALRKALPLLKKEGYSFVTIDELLKYDVIR